ncbi:uncharacterized protein [Miscanthus floridulus]|uniref:uncharacterized protein n=1 Tax=Miscanthus floridulus TaxID=154761 RepID=UPI0034574819
MSSAKDHAAQFSTFKHRVKCRTTSKNIFTIKDPSGGNILEVKFSMTLECIVTKTLKVGGNWQPVYLLYEGGSAIRILKANQAMGIPNDQEGVHDVLCGLMRTFTRLQQLNLNDEQWEDNLPEPEVPKLVALAHEAYWDGCIAHATLELWVNEQLKFIASKALLMLCAEVEAALARCWGCIICLEDETSNPMADHAVEMPGYGHAFHRKCITKWFGRRSTCPMCRRDLSMYLDPVVQRFLSYFTKEDY